MTVISAMSMSLDGFVTGPDDSREHPLGIGGEPLHAWLAEPSEQDAELLGEMAAGGGAIVMGRRSYDSCEGDAAWGDGGPAGKTPCFVVTHRVPEKVGAPDVFTFVTDGVENAIAQAKAVAGEKVVGLHGASVPQQALKAGLMDELIVHLVPILLGDGVRLFDLLGAAPVRLERTQVIESPLVTHLRFRVVR
ncbi:MAG TPA: dihydrofolate reductase family protein [Kribbella sp.]|nr:dihydrofolate reductase family protein [Kribbella sp.]